MLNENNFTHLHVHTEYSLLDGSAKIPELVSYVKKLGMESIAVTDHGSMFGIIEFYKKATAEGIKPIIGCEVYVAPGSRHDKTAQHAYNYFHLILLAETNEGYDNLLKLVSIGYTEGFYYKPRVDFELLEKYSKGLICLSACLAGPVSKTILTVSYEKAKEMALFLNDIYGDDNFFLELQDHGIPEEKIVNEKLLKIHKETNIPIVATNDCHYIKKEDSASHDVLICIQTGKTIDDPGRMRYEEEKFYVKSFDEMQQLFPDTPEALSNTNEIAKRCNVEITFGELKLPKFDVPNDGDAFSYFKQVCYDGLKVRYGDSPEEKYLNLMDFEIETIKNMGYVDYFLIVWDFIKYARDNDIMVGPGRGSAAGSIVSYCLFITNIDPVKYDLIFERFLNPERISMPDIDIDFCYERRQEVIDYVVHKYGESNVAQIITFGTLAARAAIKDVGRALNFTFAEVNALTKLIQKTPGITLHESLDNKSELFNPDLFKAYNSEESTKALIDMSLKLEGLPRHSSTHAAGVVICENPVFEYVPLISNDGAISTQYTMTTLEELGLLKMDFLGLKTLTVIQYAVKEIKRTKNIEIDIDNVDSDAFEAFELISKGRTKGIFQLENNGMMKFMKDLHPSCLEDLIAGISLYRPGPMAFIPDYIKGRKNPDNIIYLHESLEPILKTTYGCIVYQEQVMQIFRELAGYSLGRSDLVRRAISKKKADVLAREREFFINGIDGEVKGCVDNGIPANIAEKIFNNIADFANYAFNKSHAAAYAVVGYQTAWLKAFYPVEFMAALMTSVMHDSAKIYGYIEDCKKLNITLLPPDINESVANFSVSKDCIRFGLAAIKNVGKSTIDNIVLEREENGAFKNLTQLINRMETGVLNKKCIESLVKAGAFDCFNGKRSQYMLVYKSILDGVNNSRRNNIEGQISLFDLEEHKSSNDAYFEEDFPDSEEYSKKDKLFMEKEVLGIYVSGHPLMEYEDILKKYVNCISTDFLKDETLDFDGSDEIDDYIPKFNDGEIVVIGGLITSKKIIYTKKNKAMAFLTIEDFRGSVEIIVFSNVYELFGSYMLEDKIVLIKGTVSNDAADDDSKIICRELTPIDKVKNTIHKSVGIIIGKDNDFDFDYILSYLLAYSGDTPVYIKDFKTNSVKKALPNYWVTPDQDFISNMKKLLGDDCVVIKEK